MQPHHMPTAGGSLGYAASWTVSRTTVSVGVGRPSNPIVTRRLSESHSRARLSTSTHTNAVIVTTPIIVTISPSNSIHMTVQVPPDNKLSMQWRCHRMPPVSVTHSSRRLNRTEIARSNFHAEGDAIMRWERRRVYRAVQFLTGGRHE